MGLFKRFTSEPEPTKQDLADALSFKNKLKYGDDINARYKDAREKAHEAYKEQDRVKDKLAEIYNFEKRNKTENWTSFRISTFQECDKSPIGHCLYISYYGDKNPEKDDSTYCLCCKEKLY